MGIRRYFEGNMYKAMDGSNSKVEAKKKAEKLRKKPEIKSVRVSEVGASEYGRKYVIYVRWVSGFDGYDRGKPTFR